MFSFTFFVLSLVGICVGVEQESRIVGGHDTTIEEIPYQLSLMKNGVHNCGAVIIGQNWALTTARCVFDQEPASVSLRAGSSYRTEGGSIHNISKIYVFPLFDPYYQDYDMAILRVDSPFEIGTPGVDIVSLPEDETPEVDSPATVSGWGRLQSSGPLPDQLQAVVVPIMSDYECDFYYSVFGGTTSRMICAGLREGGKDACKGDSGGPLFSNTTGTLTGLASWGFGCAKPYFPGVYARTTYFRNWITIITGI